MNGLATRIVRVGAGFGALLTLGWVLAGHAAPPVQHGLAMDWTHRHVIFSQPSTAAQVQRVAGDPRYWQQFDRLHSVRTLAAEPGVPVLKFGSPALIQPKMHRDWSLDLGTNASVGAGNFPAKYSFQVTSATCGSGANPDYIVFSTGLVGSGAQASIVGYDNLYSGCSGTVPSVYWAYDTAGKILTSPVFSQDGKHVAFAQTNGSAGTLVLLKWAAGTGTVGAPVAPTLVVPSLYTTCVAPCMTQIGLKDGGGNPTDDTTSSVFIDYSNDVAWVGGAGGWLHKITPVFKGTPVEVNTGGFPVQVNPGSPTALSNAVHDFGSGDVFVGDLGGYLYQVGPTGTVLQSGRLDFGTGLVSGPIVDSTGGRIYVFSSNNGRLNCGGGTIPCASVYTFTPDFTPGTIATDVAVGGSSATPAPLYEGSFDHAYLTSGNGTGRMFVCGNTQQRPFIYMLPITAGAMGQSVTGPALATNTATCSPLSDVPNASTTGGATESIFAGVSTLSPGNSCASGGCLLSFRVQPWTPSTAYVVGQEILDTHFRIQVVRVAGTSGTTVPTWSTTRGATTTDGSVSWLTQGLQNPSHGFWFPTHVFAAGVGIVDSNNNIQLVTTAGTSQNGVHPVWNTAVNGVTNDNTVRWLNVGAIATFSISASAGTSAIIIDNVVGQGEQAGASQVYYTTLGNQVCGTSGTGGCAVQASQAALQ